MHSDVAGEARTVDVLAQMAGRIGLLHRLGHALDGTDVFAANVDVAGVAFDRVAREQNAFKQDMRVLLHDHAIFEGSRLRLIGVDDQEGYGPLRDFVGAVVDAGSDAVIVHARKAWLKGLSPKENREIPPLNYPMVYRLKNDFPELEIIINGGIEDVETGLEHLSHVDGIMLGRSAYHTPWVLAEVDQQVYGGAPLVTDPLDAIRGLYDYIERELSAGTRLHHITRHTLGLFSGLGGAKQFRRHLSQHAHRDDAGIETLENALSFIEAARERAAQRRAETENLGQLSA